MGKYIDGKLHFSTQDIANQLGLSTTTIIRWANRGYVTIRGKEGKPKKVQIEFYRFPSNGYRYLEEEKAKRLIDLVRPKI